MFGLLPDGREVHLLALGAEPGPVVEVLTLGASVHRLFVTASDGRRHNVALGHASVQDRLASGDYIGATVGRYANRIASGRFTLDGREVRVPTHDRGNALHGGPDGFDRRLWSVEHLDTHVAELSLQSPDGDMGFPGTLTVRARYEVVGDAVRIGLEATTDAPTVVNLTNHAYLNLDGDGSGTVDDHVLTLDADHYTPVDDAGIPIGGPTGGHAPVDGTPFDFREPRRIGTAVRTNHPQVRAARGIDHNVVVRGEGLRRAAVVESGRTGIRMELHTDQPGLQVYTGNFLDGSRTSSTGLAYRQGDGLALEPQLFPDSPNRPEWPSAVLLPGERYHSRIEWRFSSP